MKRLETFVCLLTATAFSQHTDFHGNAKFKPNGTPDPLCPYPDPWSTFYPDSSDCSRYFICIDGDRIHETCPEGFLWNQELLSCDDPSNVDCQITTQTPTTQTPTTQTPTTQSPTTQTPTTQTPTTQTPTTQSPTTQTPITQTSTTQTPTTQTPTTQTPTTQTTTTQTPTTQTPTTLTPTTQTPTTQTPSTQTPTTQTPTTQTPTTQTPTTQTPTTQTSTTQTPTTETPTTQTPTTQTPTTQTPTTTTWAPPHCPWPSSIITYYPNPYDCSQFYECFDGERTLNQCPEGTLWCQHLLSCDYADRVNCEDNLTSLVLRSTQPSAV